MVGILSALGSNIVNVAVDLLVSYTYFNIILKTNIKLLYLLYFNRLDRTPKIPGLHTTGVAGELFCAQFPSSRRDPHMVHQDGRQ